MCEMETVIIIKVGLIVVTLWEDECSLIAICSRCILWKLLAYKKMLERPNWPFWGQISSFWLGFVRELGSQVNKSMKCLWQHAILCDSLNAFLSSILRSGQPEASVSLLAWRWPLCTQGLLRHNLQWGKQHFFKCFSCFQHEWTLWKSYVSVSEWQCFSLSKN